MGSPKFSFMVRLATHHDIPYLVTQLLSLRESSAWANYDRDGYDTKSLTHYLNTQLLNPSSVCYVSELNDEYRGFCGAQLHRFTLPPHMLVLYEWGWGGYRRDAVQCWKSVRLWGISKGAELAGRTTARPSKSRHITELMTWEKL